MLIASSTGNAGRSLPSEVKAMRSIRRILVAVKNPDSKVSPAVVKAAQLAQALDAELELFHAVDTLYFDPAVYVNEKMANIEREIRAQTLRRLESVAARVRQRAIKVTVATEWDQPAYEAILRRARHTAADLIVAEQHRSGHVGAGLLRLTDWELLRLSALPVLLVKTPGTYRRPRILAAVDPTHAFSKPAKLDDGILRLGATLATALHGSLHALHAYTPISLSVLANGAILTDEAATRMQEHAAAEAKRNLERTLRSVKIPPARRHLVGRHPSDAIEQTARQIRSAIVVMGAVSRSALKRLLVGSTAERVLDQLACDVLIVKPTHFVQKVPQARRGARLISLAMMPGV
jgi:universal stress protein E